MLLRALFQEKMLSELQTAVEKAEEEHKNEINTLAAQKTVLESQVEVTIHLFQSLNSSLKTTVLVSISSAPPSSFLTLIID